MSKRARNEPSEYDYEYMAKKFKELERVFLHAQRKHESEKPPPSPIPPGSGSSSSSSAASSRAPSRAGSRAASRAASPAHELEPAPPAAHGSSSDSGSDSSSSSRSRSPSPDGAARASFYSHYSKQDCDKQQGWFTLPTYINISV